MKIKALALCALVVASCGVQHTPSSSATVKTGAGHQVAADAGNSPAAMTLISRVAAAPDRGAAIVYRAGRQSFDHEGFHSWPVELSEAHLRNATGPGKGISIDLPDGKQIRVSYSRDVHHQDGSWSWVGTAPDGSEVLLTLGSEAVFGSISSPQAGQYEIRMYEGQPWLAKADPARVRDADVAPGAAITDALVPRARDIAQRKLAAAQSPIIQQAAVSGTVPVIDVVLGYSLGFSAAQGGAAQANTRLDFLVETANQALARSLVSARFRVLHTQVFSYDETITNDTALNDLTNGTGTFAQLHTIRDQVGADLVAFIRPLRKEQGSCGVAWLIGSNGQPINNAWADNGYAIVSDGQYSDATYTYSCRTVTLGHEFGHNLGQAHDQADSSSPGAHPYSYGYRQDTDTGFYTVMAYKLANSNQVGIAYYANPSVSLNGIPTGIANTNDNARSLAQTIPLVAQFRTAITPFADVPTDYWSFEYIRRLSDAAITNGCATNPLRYCTGDVASREQMALFLLRARYGPAYQPPPATGIFSDVPANYWAAPWIEQLYRDGITKGCTADQQYYCPTSAVSREQMAVFLLRGRYGAGYVPTSASGFFADVPATYWAAPWIEKLAYDGVTTGCSVSPLLYCPTDSVTRDQMAVFLVRNYGL